MLTNTTRIADREVLAGYSKEELYFHEQNRKLIEQLRASTTEEQVPAVANTGKQPALLH